jgi:hypothetical protein
VPLIFVAVEQRKAEVVDLLLSFGADVDRRTPDGSYSPREIARFMVENPPTRDGAARRVAVLCGAGDPEQLIAAADAERAAARQPNPSRWVSDALELAGDDATRCGEATIRPEHLLVGILRRHGEMLFRPLEVAGVEMDRLYQRFETRLLPAAERLVRERIPTEPATRAAVAQAVEIAESREAEVVHIWHLLDALVAEDESEVSALLASVGADLSRLREELARDPFAGVRPTGT